MCKSNAVQNKTAFDLLHRHKDEIEDELGVSLTWERANEYKSSWISYTLRDVSITNEADWPRMAQFHAEWSDKICDAVLPYLQNEDDANTRLTDANLFNVKQLVTIGIKNGSARSMVWCGAKNISNISHTLQMLFAVTIFGWHQRMMESYAKNIARPILACLL